MLDREDIAAVGRGVASAVRQALKAFENRLGVLERQASVGIQSVVINNHDKDRRRFTQVITLVDGRKIETEFKLIGSMQYCEQHQVNRKYEMGDVVTHDGSMWVALRDTAGAPGKSPDWRLAVKRGQDGRTL